ncbi:unnamed protein product, partial [Ectocarpus sp. 8 AP-2014]
APAASPAAAPALAAATVTAPSGPLSSWTVEKDSNQATDLFAHHLPKPSSQARQRTETHTKRGGSAEGGQAKKARKSPARNGTNNCKTVSVQSRLKSFPGQGFTISNGKLYCGPCTRELSNDMDTVKTHIGQQKSRKAGSVNRHE